MFSYKITKYDPAWTDERLKREWTSINDIKTVEQKRDYATIENAYINTVQKICDHFNIEEFQIKELELYSPELPWKEGEIIVYSNIHGIVRDILREQMWCKLWNKNFEFHFGYDYYMYFISRTKPLNGMLIDEDLFMENVLSPYLNE